MFFCTNDALFSLVSHLMSFLGRDDVNHAATVIPFVKLVSVELQNQKLAILTYGSFKMLPHLTANCLVNTDTSVFVGGIIHIFCIRIMCLATYSFLAVTVKKTRMKHQILSNVLQTYPLLSCILFNKLNSNSVHFAC